jgi:hypothetical protein
MYEKSATLDAVELARRSVRPAYPRMAQAHAETLKAAGPAE